LKTRILVAVPACLLVFSAGGARAQSTPTTCTWEPAGTVRVAVHGRATTIEATPEAILVNGVACGAPDQVELVRVDGGELADRVTLIGEFAPGYTPEASDFDELEVEFYLSDGADTVTVNLGEQADLVRVIGIWVLLNTDGDSDIRLGDVELVKLAAHGGDDWIQAFESSQRVHLYGGSGNDVLQGSDVHADRLYGEGGDDTLQASGGNDLLDGGPGADYASGGSGNDTLVQGAAADGGDELNGGTGIDTVDYSQRTAPVTISIGATSSSGGGPDDGEAGEGDEVASDIEKATGGSGDDVLTGTDEPNTLTGGGGRDVLIGNAGGDTLVGGDGGDHLVGGAGPDKMWGDGGADTLEGESGADTLHGGAATDVLDGGAGADAYFGEGGNDFLYNDDGVAETVNCGPGNADDAEVDSGATDTFIGCEL
jgi:Ca2+-binding RTX toxin-like protein